MLWCSPDMTATWASWPETGAEYFDVCNVPSQSLDIQRTEEPDGTCPGPRPHWGQSWKICCWCHHYASTAEVLDSSEVELVLAVVGVVAVDVVVEVVEVVVVVVVVVEHVLVAWDLVRRNLLDKLWQRPTAVLQMWRLSEMRVGLFFIKLITLYLHCIYCLCLVSMIAAMLNNEQYAMVAAKTKKPS